MWLAVAIAAVAVCVAAGAWAARARARGGLRPPEYPGGLPLIGHGHLFASGNSVALWKLLQNICAYGVAHGGGVVGFGIGPKRAYVVSDPDDCVTLANTALEKDILYDFMKFTLGEGLLTGAVPIWKTHRRLLTPAFSQRVLDGFIGVFNSQAKRLVSSVDKEAGNKPFDFWPHIGPNALETVYLTAMGGAKADERLSNEYIHATEILYSVIIQRFQKFWLHNNFIFNLSSLAKTQFKYGKIVNDVSDAVLQKKKSELKKEIIKNGDESNKKSGSKFKSFIDLILEYSGDKNVLSDQEIREELNTIIVAGHDTSASTIVYALILLGSHPDVQERVYKEIAEVLGDRDVEKQDLPKLVFLEAVLKETLRLYPIGPFIARRLTENVKLKNYTLPAGSGVHLALYALHRHQMWGDDAELFLPERWLDKARVPEHQAAFAAFSLGRRMCIGKNYGLMSLKTTLVHLVRSFRIKSNISKLQLKLDIMLRPHAGHHIAVERRT